MTQPQIAGFNELNSLVILIEHYSPLTSRYSMANEFELAMKRRDIDSEISSLMKTNPLCGHVAKMILGGATQDKSLLESSFSIANKLAAQDGLVTLYRNYAYALDLGGYFSDVRTFLENCALRDIVNIVLMEWLYDSYEHCGDLEKAIMAYEKLCKLTNPRQSDGYFAKEAKEFLLSHEIPLLDLERYNSKLEDFLAKSHTSPSFRFSIKNDGKERWISYQFSVDSVFTGDAVCCMNEDFMDTILEDESLDRISSLIVTRFK
ncbi:hypothetical protein [Marinomonas atlantica]|uniref:hypothetical protein n=1 Tax=Marinomonas atlantica TaxID=1806668 RepID=UPI00083546B0|nr:hypothetical protein [Marinomonas atlantica]